MKTGIIFPSLIQLQGGVTVAEDWRQKDLCATKYMPKDAINKRKISDSEVNRENECEICMEMNNRIVLPICSHSMCIKCYQDWYVIIIRCLYHCVMHYMLSHSNVT